MDRLTNGINESFRGEVGNSIGLPGREFPISKDLIRNGPARWEKREKAPP